MKEKMKKRCELLFILNSQNGYFSIICSFFINILYELLFLNFKFKF